MSVTDLYRRTQAIALTLTGWPSVTGTPDEAAFAARLTAWLREQPKLVAAGLEVTLAPIAGDLHGRANVLALLRGCGARTVALCGHFDTVPFSDYGELAPLALQPDLLRTALIERLRTSAAAPKVLADLESGEYLPGRGLLDMKSGLAAGIAALELFANDHDRQGNLLLIATPDEEDRSTGMRAAADLLPAFCAERALDLTLGINLDAISDQGDGEKGRVVGFGGIGKLLLSALVVGKETHACYPLDGVNAAYLAAEIAAELELAPELAEETGGELAAPPTALALRDLKGEYNVTTPGRVWATWNVLFQRRSPETILSIAGELIRRAIVGAAARMAERGSRLANAMSPGPAWSRIPLIIWHDLYRIAGERSADFADRFASMARALAASGDLDLPARCRRLTEFAWDAAALDGPAVVLGFASMPYPAANWPRSAAAEALETRILAATRQVRSAFDTGIGVVRHLEIISDMSFLAPIEPAALRLTAEMTPAWGSSIVWDIDGKPPTPAIPMLNIGPWGRDYHQWSERVHTPYAFEVLPRLVHAVAAAALAPEGYQRAGSRLFSRSRK